MKKLLEIGKYITAVTVIGLAAIFLNGIKDSGNENHEAMMDTLLMIDSKVNHVQEDLNQYKKTTNTHRVYKAEQAKKLNEEIVVIRRNQNAIINNSTEQKDILERIKKNHINRALRIDKMTLAALEATLHLYRDETKAVAAIPTLSMLTMPAKLISARARGLGNRLKKLSSKRLEAVIVDSSSRVGGTLSVFQVIMPSRRTSISILTSPPVAASMYSWMLIVPWYPYTVSSTTLSRYTSGLCFIS